MNSALAIAAACGAVLAAILTGAVRRYAQATSLLDVPNARSSHAVPTPRGGGIAIVLSFLSILLVLAAFGRVEIRLVVALTGSAITVALLGFLDDRSSVPARWRFLGHLAAAVWVLAWMGPVPPVPMLGAPVALGLAGPLLCGLFLVWMVNQFNFMDGIDGIAGAEAVFVGLGGALLWWLAGSGTGWQVALVFAACVFGFLLWNLPPAKIFMGDVGSGFLGLVLGTLALWCGQQAPHLFWAWFILLGCFMVDATTTLVRRVRRGERFNEAHRSHAYQYAARRHGSHRTVTLACAVLNVAWLLPLAVLVAMRKLDGVVGVILAYAPLVWLAFHYKAGARDQQGSLS
ncbi:MAG: glycosyltransferase family 4 protein [Burkholderiaceae bacterium]